MSFYRYVLVLTLKILLTGRSEKQEMEGLLGEKLGHILENLLLMSLRTEFFSHWCAKVYMKKANEKKKKSTWQTEYCSEAKEICLDLNKLFYYEHLMQPN